MRFRKCIILPLTCVFIFTQLNLGFCQPTSPERISEAAKTKVLKEAETSHGKNPIQQEKPLKPTGSPLKAPTEQKKQTAAKSAPEKQAITVRKQVLAESMPSYNMRLQQIIAEAKKNIKLLNVEIKNKDVEAKVRSHFEKGQLYRKQGELRKAKKEMQKVVDLSRGAQFRKYVRREDQRQQQKTTEQKWSARQTQIEATRTRKGDRKSTRLNSSHIPLTRMPSSA